MTESIRGPVKWANSKDNNPGGMRTWTPERDAMLARLWGEHWTASQIAQEFGTTRNSVIGRVHRLNLPKRPNPIAKTENPSPEALYRRAWRRKEKFGQEAHAELCAARKARRVARMPAPPPRPAAVVVQFPKPAPARVPVARDGCRWTDSSGAPWVFCGQPAHGSWCDEHRARVFQPRRSAETA